MPMISMKRNALLSRLRVLLSFKRFNHGLVEIGAQARPRADIVSDAAFEPEWKKLDSRTLGISSSMIPESSWIVLKILQNEGFKAYLVGGCVRDLILRRTPKDFDVITTANLTQVQKQFRRSVIVGTRFPICIVHIKNSAIEVSSFQTAQQDLGKENFLASQRPRKCDKSDLVLWRDCQHRDFTVNSLFFNPFASKIYDYANGLMDLKSLKLRTLIPAYESFLEDNARILRGVRIAARLGFSFSTETETAIHKLSSSLTNLSKFRIMLELNYMLSYGAAQPSLSLLQRLGLLEILLPFHAAYLSSQASKSGQSATMLMKLFSNLDRLVSCDQPSDSTLWVGLLAFHLALVEKPQHPLVVLGFASVLYYRNWKKAVWFARQRAQSPIHFEPEILDADDHLSDAELAEKVTQLTLLIQDSIDVLTKTDTLLEVMARFPGFPCSGLVFVPKMAKSKVVSFFNGIEHIINTDTNERTDFKIDYNMLKKRNVRETRFVIGKLILDTMGCRVDQGVEDVPLFEENFQIQPDMEKLYSMAKDDKKRAMSPSNSEVHQEGAKWQKVTGKPTNNPSEYEKQAVIVEESAKRIEWIDKGLAKKEECQTVAKNYQKTVSGDNSGDCIAKNQENLTICHSTQTKNTKEDVLKREKRGLQQLWEDENYKVTEVDNQEKGSRMLLSDLFK